MKYSIFLFLSALLLVACSSEPKEDVREEIDSEQVSEPVSDEVSEEVIVSDPEVLAEGLEIPWSINKADNVFYISERTGTIAKIENGTVTHQKVNLAKPLATEAEAGLLGLVLTPDFENTGKAIAYYTYQGPARPLNRVIELYLQGDTWEEKTVLLDEIPSGQFHHGGRLELGPDDKLYITTGDATEPELAQSLDSLAGKILRMNLDGSIPEDNPFPDSYIYSYGHRNPQGIAWNNQGKMFASEHGPSAHDEINEIIPGANYGWPEIIGDETKAGMREPLFHSGKDTWAPSGIATADGKIYAATLRGNAVREFDLEKGTTRAIIIGFGRIRDVFIEGDTLYFVSNNTDGRGTPLPNDDRLYRISLSAME